MAKLIVVAHDTEAGLRKKLRHARDEAFKSRIKAIILALQGKKRFEICSQLAVDEKSVTVWVHRYSEGGSSALISNKGGRKEGNPKWDSSVFEALAKEVDKGGYWSIPRMQEWIREQYKKDIPEQTVWYRMDQLDYSYKGARPHPVQGNKDAQNAFKKGAWLRSWSR